MDKGWTKEPARVMVPEMGKAHIKGACGPMQRKGLFRPPDEMDEAPGKAAEGRAQESLGSNPEDKKETLANALVYRDSLIILHELQKDG